jgi:S1-C subfamily serine protease
MALIPPFFIDCVVAIGADDAEGKRKWIASGFLYGHPLTNSKGDQKLYKVLLVTNRHVFQGLTKAYLRFNPQADEPAREYNLDLLDKDGTPLWLANPKGKADIAVIPINFNLLKEHAMQVAFFHSDEHVASTEKMNELGITEGDFAYVLGFPMGLIGGQRNTVVVRSGSIARIRDALTKANQTFLVDAFVFPGNSGGPVVSKPEALSIEGTKSQNAAYLIGIVQSYVPYQDLAVSLQTKRPRVVFEENSGLAAVHPVDLIEETVQIYLKLQADKEEGAKA